MNLNRITVLPRQGERDITAGHLEKAFAFYVYCVYGTQHCIP